MSDNDKPQASIGHKLQRCNVWRRTNLKLPDNIKNTLSMNLLQYIEKEHTDGPIAGHRNVLFSTRDIIDGYSLDFEDGLEEVGESSTESRLSYLLQDLKQKGYITIVRRYISVPIEPRDTTKSKRKYKTRKDKGTKRKRYDNTFRTQMKLQKQAEKTRIKLEREEVERKWRASEEIEIAKYNKFRFN